MKKSAKGSKKKDHVEVSLRKFADNGTRVQLQVLEVVRKAMAELVKIGYEHGMEMHEIGLERGIDKGE